MKSKRKVSAYMSEHAHGFGGANMDSPVHPSCQPAMDAKQQQLEAAMQWVKRFGHTETGHHAKVLSKEVLRLRSVREEQASRIRSLEAQVDRLEDALVDGNV
jgi:hypothetical protein